MLCKASQYAWGGMANFTGWGRSVEDLAVNIPNDRDIEIT